MKSGKRAEYRAAKTMGGKRIALSGGRGQPEKGDVTYPGWHVEVKYRKQFHTFTLFLEAEREAKKQGKNTLLILTEKNTHGQLAVMRLEYFKELPKVE